MPPKRIIEVEVLVGTKGTAAASAEFAMLMRNMERTGRGALAGTVAITGMGRAIAFASSQFLAGYGLLYAITASTKAAMNFQQQMLLIKTQAGDTSSDIGTLSKEVLNLSSQVGTGPDQLAKGLYHIESSGVRGAKAIKELKIAAMGAKIGMDDLQSVTNALIAAQKSGMKGTGDMAKTMATLDAITGAANMRLEDLTKAMRSGITGTARQVGISLTDLGAAMSVLTIQGVPGQMAATRLRTSLALLAAPTAKATKELKAIGIAPLELARTIRSHGLLGGLTLLADKLKQSGDSAAQATAVIVRAFGAARSSATIIQLLQHLDQFESGVKRIQQGTAQFAAKWQAQIHTAAFATDQLKANLQVLEVFIGQAILPTVVHFSNELSHWLSNTKNQIHIQNDFKAVLNGIKEALLAVKLILTPFEFALGGWGQLIRVIVGYKFAKVIMGWGDAALITAKKFGVLAGAEKAAAVAAAEAAAVGGAAAGGAAVGLGMEQASVAGAKMTPFSRMYSPGMARQEADMLKAQQVAIAANYSSALKVAGRGAGETVVASKEAATALKSVTTAEEVTGAAAVVMAAKINIAKVAVMGLGLLRGAIIPITIVWIFKTQIKSTINGFAAWLEKHGFSGKQPGSSGAFGERHFPGIAFLQDKTEPIFNFLTFGTAKDNQDKRDAERKKFLHDSTLSQFVASPMRLGLPAPRDTSPGASPNLANFAVPLSALDALAQKLAMARLAVAKGSADANARLIAVLQEQIRLDEIGVRIQQRLIKKGIDVAGHNQSLLKVLADETAAFSEIKSLKQEANRKSYELPMSLQIAQAKAAYTDEVNGGDAASKSVARQILELTKSQVASGKVRGADLVAAINAMTAAQQTIDTFNVPVEMALAAAEAAVTVTLNDDISVAKKEYNLVMKMIHSGKVHGKALQNLWEQAAGFLSTMRQSNFQVPMKLQLALAKAQTTVMQDDDRKAWTAIRNFAEAYLKSKNKTLAGIKDAYDMITQANSALGTVTQKTAYTMASTHKLTAGLGFTRSQRIAEEQRIAQMEAHDGRVPKGGWLGVMGYAVNANASSMGARGAGPSAVTVHTPNVTIHAAKVVGAGSGSVIININGGNVAQIERAVLKALQKKRGYSAPQRRGANGGHVLGAD